MIVKHQKLKIQFNYKHIMNMLILLPVTKENYLPIH